MCKDVQPTLITIFGIFGDLSKRKLLPALHTLYVSNLLPKDTKILGVSRREKTDTELREYIYDVVGIHDNLFIDMFIYQKVDLLEENDYLSLGKKIKEIDSEVSMNRLFHLAIPPTLYKSILINLGKSGLSTKQNNIWSRILIEKPFGFDLETAQELNNIIDKYLEEDQIYRVDHYLAKDPVESLLEFRFSDNVFSKIWNKDNIEYMHIKMHEMDGVENRGAFYESVGALRDIGQNHMLQLLAILTMEKPKNNSTAELSLEREKVLSALKTYTTDGDVQKNTLRAQYIEYKEIQNIPKNSNTETFFALRAFINNDRWEGVPFVLDGGKALKENLLNITVGLKHGTVVQFLFNSDNKIEISILNNNCVDDECIGGRTIVLDSSGIEKKYCGSAYAELISDVISGDKTLFPSRGEVVASWIFIDAILNSWNHFDDIIKYKFGSTPDISNINTHE